MIAIPDAIAAAWGWRREDIAPLAGGLINDTFVVRGAGGPPSACLQRLHPVFAGRVNLDIDAVTAHLAARGVQTPRVIRTRAGDAWRDDADGRAWRALTWIDGETVHRVPALAWAETAGECVGSFHRALADFRHDYAFTRPGVHDTPAHLAKLAALARAAAGAAAGADREAGELAHEIADAARGLPAMPALPARHIHGDLKISNVMFALRDGAGAAAGAAPPAIALVDLDTVARGTLAFELGDAMRSWCNPRGEDAGAVEIDVAIFAAAIAGFRRAADAVTTADERRSIAVGLETVCVELAARFAADVFEDRYFGWDATRFRSRREHNVVRARGQLALAHAVRAVRGELLAILA